MTFFLEVVDPHVVVVVVFFPIQVRMQLYGQLNPGKPIPSFPTILSNMVKHDGFLSIYKGVDAAIGRQLVYGTARIGLHRKFSDKLVELNDGNPISFVQKALSGMASGSVAVCIGTPFDIALVRLQSDGMAKSEDRRNYKNVFDVSQFRPNRDKQCKSPVMEMWRCSYTHFVQFNVAVAAVVGFDPNGVGRRSRSIIPRTGAKYLERNVHECGNDGVL